MLKKEKIRFTGNDINIKINIGGNNAFYGYNQSIENFVRDQSQQSINEPTDVEVVRFALDEINQNTKLFFEFYDGEEETHAPSFENAGFTKEEIISYSEQLRNSFFSIDLYDGFELYSSEKVVSKYYTKFNIVEEDQTKLDIYNVNQLKHLLIPKSFLDEFFEDTITLYVRFFFYNAKFGFLTPFYNAEYHDGSDYTTSSPIRMYFKITLNKNTKKWRFEETNEIIAKELIGNENYRERIDESLDSVDVKRQNYPPKSYFDWENQTYFA